jgi:hypothetical protein
MIVSYQCRGIVAAVLPRRATLRVKRFTRRKVPMITTHPPR